MGPDKTPSAWLAAQVAIREHVIEAARRGRKVTYGEIAVVAHETTGLNLGSFMFNRMCMDINRRSDGCLISSIIVRNDTGEPGDGFLPYARGQGFDAPLASLQRGVFERFAP